MKRLLTALVLIPLVLLAVFRAPDWLFFALVGVVALLATIEYLQIVEAYGVKVFRWTTLVAVGGMFAIPVWWNMQRAEVELVANLCQVILVLFMTLVLVPSLYLCVGMREQDLKSVLPGAAMSAFAVPYIGGAMLSLALLRTIFAAGWYFVLFTFFAVWVGDSAAYYVGRSIGRIKFSPRISPSKTWEGAIASVVGAVAMVALFNHFAPQIESWMSRIHLLPGDVGRIKPAPLTIICLLGALINIAAQLGDLFESLIKRGAGVKDSGTLLPGHGGMLDRIDALLFAAPVAFLLFFRFVGRFFGIF